MTKLKRVNDGFNKYCGPAVLSILTGHDTDTCARIIGSINGRYEVTGVTVEHLLVAANRLGFAAEKVSTEGTFFRTLVMLAQQNGIYVVMVTGHFVVIEIADNKIYFCDNHTKEPISAAASARHMQACLGAYRIVKKPDFKEPVVKEPTVEFKVIKQKTYDDLWQIDVIRHTVYSDGFTVASLNKSFTLNDNELRELVAK